MAWWLLLGLVGLLGCESLSGSPGLPADRASPGKAAIEAPDAQPIVIESVTVIDAANPRRVNQRVVIEGDRIVRVAPMSSSIRPSSARVVDGRGRFLIPGLWDAHVHFLYDEALTQAMPDLFLDYGITSVRDTGGDLEQMVALRKAWREQGRARPRIHLAGPLLDGGHVVYDGATAAQPPLGVSVPTSAVARERVALAKSRGADFIKIYELVSPEVFAALVEAARREGLPIASHVPLSLAADVAGPQVDSMEHLRNIELACAESWRALLESRRERIAHFEGDRGYPLRRALHEEQRLAAIAAYDGDRCHVVIESLRGTMQVPTLRLNAFNRSRPDRLSGWSAAAERLPEVVEAKWRAKVEELAREDESEGERDMRFADWSLRLVGQMREAGIPVAAGTDTPIRLAIPGESLHRELELLVRTGMTPREALAAATIEPARFFSLEGEMGQVLPGMRADLVLLSADPLTQISHTRAIDAVMSRGVWVRGASAAR